MATRALQILDGAVIRSYTAGTAITKGYALKFGSDDTTLTNCGANEHGVAIALESATTGNQAQVALLSGGAVIPVLVGTGGATRGAYAVTVADGVTDQTVGGGTTLVHVLGTFLQSGSAGDYVGLLPMPCGTVKA